MVKHRTRCYMDIEVGGVPMGRIVFELFNDICPKTCENFRALCTGEVEGAITSSKPLRYVSSIFHRVVKGFMIQGGDFTASNGTGGESIYGGFFEDENFIMKHDVPYRLSMANRGKDTNGSQFYITTSPAPHLDGIHVVFGELKVGQNIVQHLESLPVDRACRPLQDIKIVKCGELVIKPSKHKTPRTSKVVAESSSSKSSASDSDSDLPAVTTNKQRTKEGKKSKQSDHVDTEDGEVDEGNRHPLVSVSNICPEDIPDVPVNRLLRDNRRNARDQGSYDSRSQSGIFSRSNARPRASKSGRQIKGRGTCRYRTPSPSRDRSSSPQRSRTPPHWVSAQKRTIKLSEYQKMEEAKRREADRKKQQQTEIVSRKHNKESRPSRSKHSRQDVIESKSADQLPESREESDKLPLDYNALDYEVPEIDVGKAEGSNSSNSDGDLVDNNKKRYRKRKTDTVDDDGGIPVPAKKILDDSALGSSLSGNRESDQMSDLPSNRTKENSSHQEQGDSNGVSRSSRHDDDHRSRRRRSYSRDRKITHSSRKSSWKDKPERRHSSREPDASNESRDKSNVGRLSSKHRRHSSSGSEASHPSSTKHKSTRRHHSTAKTH